MRFSAKYLAMALALIVLALPALAKPNFSGDWKVNVSKSDFGQMPAPSSMTGKITHQDPSLKVAIKQSGERGDFEYEMSYSTDGKETTNEIRDNTMKSTAKWDGDVLVIDTKGSFGGNDVTIQDKMSLSADGKTLTLKRHFSSSMGEMDQALILEKQ
jgi:hypothetical protein